MRQDSCIDVQSGYELLLYPNKAQFSEQELKLLNQNTQEKFNFLQHYSIKNYLSKLKISAHQLNSKFHYTMCQIMGIENDNDNDLTNKEISLTYSAGPVKKLERWYDSPFFFVYLDCFTHSLGLCVVLCFVWRYFFFE